MVELSNPYLLRPQLIDSRAHRGTFLVPATFGHRVGRLSYRKSHAGRAQLADNLVASLYPPAAADPINYPGVVRYYVDPLTGNDANTGLSWSQALKRVPVALAKSDVDVVLCRGGVTYFFSTSGGQQSMATYTGTRDIVMVGVGAPARFTAAYQVTWSPHATLPNVWQSSSTGGTVVRVVDLRQRTLAGDYVALTNVGSAALVDSTPGSWFYSASTAYVRLSDGATPDDNILVLRQLNHIVQAPGVTFYMRNIDFIGGGLGSFQAIGGDASTVIIAEDCWFTQHWIGPGLYIRDVGICVCIRCKASGNASDGFNYHEDAGLSPHFIEIDCVGTANLPVNTGNGSTAHESVIGFRMNCDYWGNGGPGIADVNTSKTFNVSCTSRGNTGHSNASGVTISNTTECWIDGGTFADNQGSDVIAANTSTLHLRDVYIEDGAPVNTSGTATIDAVFA